MPALNLRPCGRPEGAPNQSAFWPLLSPKLSCDFTLTGLRIDAGKTLEIPFGPPLIARAQVQTRRRTATIGAVLIGQGGETYQPGVFKRGRQEQAPKFKIVDKRGKELAKGQFEYG